MKFFIIIVISFFSMTAHSSASVSDAVAFDVTEGATLLQQCSRSTPTGNSALWVVSEKELFSVETQLQKEFTKVTKGRLKDLSFYQRQYIGITIGGKKQIYINAFRREKSIEWKKKAVMVCDGGESFWGIVYDIESKTFLDFQANGSA